MRLTDKEAATILAALRNWQRNVDPQDRGDSDHFSEDEPLTDAEIDDLCKRINTRKE